ncbi:hypothetical protein SD70_20885 [Gordoniibacillus kamchatkensis]|uniref:ABC transporter permease n=1 Tax=Gordoniibacillus kamchatkensis TaxID=1590651 RepID=A0ABR5ADZ0_9BACL|nr:ABC transporter permease [Paenibacillus sp. VKM B-2647]KIL39266.1 hypothetical protein SD70_20885 [Paenibacillus sp. VKM B-2647]
MAIPVTTPAKLWLHRAGANARFQAGIVRAAVDWTVALYIVIPALVYASIQYIAWWRHPPASFALVPAAALSGLFFLLSLRGSGYRFFVLEPDQLFVRANRRWTRRMLALGLLYSAALQTLAAAGLAGLLLPLLRAMPVSAGLQLRLVGAGWALWLVAGLARYLLQLRLAAGWRLWLAQAGLALASALATIAATLLAVYAPATGYPAALVALAGAWLLFARARLRQQGAFLREAELEQRAKLRLAGLLLNGFAAAPRPQSRRTPLVFRRSQTLFRYRSPISGLSEVLLKSFLRSFTMLRLYAMFTSAAAIAVCAVSFAPVRTAIWLGCAFLLSLWMKAYCKEVAAAPFLALLPWRDRTRIGALRKCTHLLMLPGFLVVSAAFGYAVGGWIGAAVFAAAGFAIAYFIAAVATIWY